jgi:hypothetical protein
MKATFFLLLTLSLSSLLPAQVPTPATAPALTPVEATAAVPPEKPEWREFATADVRNVLFNATTGFLLFTVGNVNFRYSPQYGSEATSAANVSAVAATLGELRRAKRFKVRIPANEKEKTINVADLVIMYETLN